jgi:hypothetical protein
MNHPDRYVVCSGVFYDFPPGAVGDLAGTEDHHIGFAELFFDTPFLTVKNLEGYSQGFGGFNVVPVKPIHPAD